MDLYVSNKRGADRLEAFAENERNLHKSPRPQKCAWKSMISSLKFPCRISEDITVDSPRCSG